MKRGDLIRNILIAIVVAIVASILIGFIGHLIDGDSGKFLTDHNGWLGIAAGALYYAARHNDDDYQR